MKSLFAGQGGEGRARVIALVAAVVLPLLAFVALGSVVTRGAGVLALGLPVLVVAWHGGAAAGLVATVVGALAAAFTLLAGGTALDALWLAIFVVQGLLTSAFFEHAQRRALRQARDQEALNLEHAFHQAVAGLSGDCAWQGRTINGHLVLDRVSRSFAEITGLSMEQVNERGGWTSLVHEDDRVGLIKQLHALGPDGRVTTEMRLSIRGQVVRCEGYLQALPTAADDPPAVVGTMRDVTARHELVEQLREWKDRYEATVMATGLMLYDFDHLTRQVVFGGNTDGVLGYWPGQLNGDVSDWIKRLHPADMGRFEREVADARAEARPFNLEYRVQGADGCYVSVEDHGRFLPSSEPGQPRRIVGFLRDVTEQRKIEQALHRREEQFRLALEGVRVGVWEWDFDAQEITDAQLTECLFGLKPDDATHENAAARIHADDRDALLQDFAAAVDGQVSYDHEFRVVWDDGSVRWLRSLGRRTLTDDGRPRFLGVTYEITDQKRAAERIAELNGQLQDKVRELETVFDLAPIGLGFATDARCDGILANEALASMLQAPTRVNVSLSAPDAAPVVKVFQGERELGIAELPMQRAASTGRPVINEENELRFPDGHAVALKSSAAPLFDERGEVRGCVGAFIDVTEQRRLERELGRRLDDLKHADRRKDEFLATLAHELRNPLAPIRNASMLLGLQDGTPQSIDWVRRVIDRQTDHLARLIDDLLDVSRITRDKLTLRLERVELSRVIDNAVESVRSQLEAQRHRLTISAPEGVWLQGDQVRLTQIFANLLNNAVKYTSPGGAIQVTAAAEGNSVNVAVRDNGVGIPSDQMSHLFEMFYQVDRSIERAHAGLGIGLTLVQRLVRMHGGEVSVSSEGIGRGSEFTVRLPLADRPARSEAPAQPSGRSVRGLRILVADDSVDSALTLTALLSAAGHNVEAVHDGFAALQRAAEFRPHVMVLDIGMPGLNGYDTCRRIRAEPWGRNAVIIAVTGWGADEDRRRSREAGFDAHLVKPVDYSELQKYFSADNIAL